MRPELKPYYDDGARDAREAVEREVAGEKRQLPRPPKLTASTVMAVEAYWQGYTSTLANDGRPEAFDLLLAVGLLQMQLDAIRYGR